MSADETPETSPASNLPEELGAISFSEFLESSPPGQVKKIDALIVRMRGAGGLSAFHLSCPEIRLHCGHGVCGGVRVFRLTREVGPEINNRGSGYTNNYVTYVCSNCQDTKKVFSLASKIQDTDSGSGSCYKFGEFPAYGPPIPSRLVNLIGPDREMFLRGRRCENQGLGIGAFVYYRRVVENQKGRILAKIIEVSELLSAPSEMIVALRAAQAETQFTKAMQSVRDTIPESLKIKGQNPLTLLHSALSDGLHARDDQTCLSLAHAVRVVLVELSDRIGQATKDTQEINDAVSLLMTSRNQ